MHHIKSLFIASLTVFLFNGCTKNSPAPSPTKPIVTFSLSTITSGIDTIMENYVVVRGFIADTGRASITDYGFILSTDTTNLISTQPSSSPKIIKKSLGARIGGGGFTAKITGLTRGTSYSIAAFATNSAGTGYSTDSLVNKIDIKFTTLSLLRIGDYYGGGVIFYLMQPGDTTYNPQVQHGLIVSTTPTRQVAWTDASVQNIVPCNALKQGLLNGKANTDSIIKYNPSPIVTAASWARSCRDGFFTDWYLPNMDELYKLSLGRTSSLTLLVAVPAYRYWTSLEIDATNTNKFFAKALDFSGNFIVFDNKNIQNYVAIIRSF